MGFFPSPSQCLRTCFPSCRQPCYSLFQWHPIWERGKKLFYHLIIDLNRRTAGLTGENWNKKTIKTNSSLNYVWQRINRGQIKNIQDGRLEKPALGRWGRAPDIYQVGRSQSLLASHLAVKTIFETKLKCLDITTQIEDFRYIFISPIPCVTGANLTCSNWVH